MSKKVLHVAEVRRTKCFFPFFFFLGSPASLKQKPSVAAAIASVLGGNRAQKVSRPPLVSPVFPLFFFFPSFSHCGRQRKGKSVYNPLFEFTYNWRGGVARKFVVTR